MRLKYTIIGINSVSSCNFSNELSFWMDWRKMVRYTRYVQCNCSNFSFFSLFESSYFRYHYIKHPCKLVDNFSEFFNNILNLRLSYFHTFLDFALINQLNKNFTLFYSSKLIIRKSQFCATMELTIEPNRVHLKDLIFKSGRFDKHDCAGRRKEIVKEQKVSLWRLFYFDEDKVFETKAEWCPAIRIARGLFKINTCVRASLHTHKPKYFLYFVSSKKTRNYLKIWTLFILWLKQNNCCTNTF